MPARRWIVLTVALLAATPAFAGPYEDALNAYDRADYTTALRLYRVAAQDGHPQAQISLGMMYAFGRGANRNPAEAVRWYRLAAAQGEVHAHTLMGAMYEAGQGVEADLLRAYMWYHLAALEAPGREADRDRVAGKLTFPQLAQAQEMAAACQRSNYKQCD
jgi:uncharacterized protein